MAQMANIMGAKPPLTYLDYYPFDREEREEREKAASTVPNPIGIEVLKVLVAP